MLVRTQHYDAGVSQDVITGQSIAKSHWEPWQRGRFAACWKLGLVRVEPSTKMAANVFRVSVPLVDAAIKELEPAIAERKNGASVVAAILNLWPHLTDADCVELGRRLGAGQVWDRLINPIV